MAADSSISITDLDAHPEHLGNALRLFAQRLPGRYHAVCGDPPYLGLKPNEETLAHTLGVLIAVAGGQVLGALAICPYSNQQVTVWGPVVEHHECRRGIGSKLLKEARLALEDGGFESIRMLVDTRNRSMRSFAFANGLSPWQNNLIFQRDLLLEEPTQLGGVSRAKSQDHDAVAAVLTSAFPKGGHCDRPLYEREREGYRHHVLQDSGHIIGAAAVRTVPGRSWLHLIGVHANRRGHGHGRQLLEGVLTSERRLGARMIALEVLESNQAAIAMYRSAGFTKAFTTSIFTGPV